MRLRRRVYAVMAVMIGVVSLSSSVAYPDDTSDMVLKILIKKGIISQQDVDEMRKELESAKKVSAEKAPVPEKKDEAKAAEWTQNIRPYGDVRFRTRGDWGKTSQTGAGIDKQRWYESVRGRVGLDAKVNEWTSAGLRLEGTGGTGNPRSADDTINNYWQKYQVYFDQYWIRFEPPKDLAEKYAPYMSSAKLWTGRFPIPFETTEMEWDTDITVGGWALQYVSPKIHRFRCVPPVKLYGTIAMTWLQESANFNTDPILWGFQGGFVTEKFGPFGSTLNVGKAVYDFANLQHKAYNATSSALTNSYVWVGDGYSSTAPLIGTYAYEFLLLDVILKLDNETFFDYNFPHGFMADFVYNAGCHGQNTNKAYMAGGYIGKAKLKDPKDWKISAEYRHIGRDAIPDFMPDSNFFGFGTYTAGTTAPNVNGLPSAGGTNTRGIKTAFDYQLFKNTTLSAAYYYMKPIKSFDKRDPYHEVLLDLVAKF